MKCNCYGILVIEIKWPAKLKKLSIENEFSAVEFLTKVDDRVHVKTSHRYYMLILIQMGIVKAKQGYFVTWSKMDPVIEQVMFDNTYVVSCLLDKTHLNYCVLCSEQ